jgi:hypothetical protein
VSTGGFKSHVLFSVFVLPKVRSGLDIYLYGSVRETALSFNDSLPDMFILGLGPRGQPPSIIWCLNQTVYFLTSSSSSTSSILASPQSQNNSPHNTCNHSCTHCAMNTHTTVSWSAQLCRIFSLLSLRCHLSRYCRIASS